MNTNIGICVSFFVVLVIISIVYLSKKEVEIPKNKCFKMLLLSTIAGLLLETSMYILALSLNSSANTYLLICMKLLYIEYTFWMLFFILYAVIILFNIQNPHEVIYQKLKKSCGIIFLLALILSIVLPINITFMDTYFYPQGPGDILQYVVLLLGIGIISALGLIKKNKLHEKEAIPLTISVILFIFCFITQFFLKEILFIVPSHAVILLIVYFTMDNMEIKSKLENSSQQSNSSIKQNLNKIIELSDSNLDYRSQIPQEVIENSKKIKDISQSTLEMISVDNSQVTEVKLELGELPYHFVEEVSNMCKTLEDKMIEKNITFDLKIMDNIPYELIGDKEVIKAVIYSLLTNSIKYTKAGSISLNIQSVNDIDACLSKLIIICKDTGVGISDEDLTKLFTKNELKQKNRTLEDDGLSLAKIKDLLDAMGGSIHAQSQLGNGTIFVVHIPQKISQFVSSNAGSETPNELENLVLPIEKID